MVVPLPNGEFHGLSMGVILTTCKSWDDPPSDEINPQQKWGGAVGFQSSSSHLS